MEEIVSRKTKCRAIAIATFSIVFSLQLFGQELKPYRIFLSSRAMNYGSLGVGVEYAFDVGVITLGAEVDACSISGGSFALNAGFQVYPFNNLGKGFYSGANFEYYNGIRNFRNDTGDIEALGITVGWKWMLFKFVDLHIGLGGEYILPSSTYTYDFPLTPRSAIGLGYAW